jgi:hypothetical protein
MGFVTVSLGFEETQRILHFGTINLRMKAIPSLNLNS